MTAITHTSRESEMKTTKYETAKLAALKTKTNNLGVSIAIAQFEIESENPELDFAPLLSAQRTYVSLTIEQSRVRTFDD